MRRVLIVVILIISCLLPLTAAARGTVPEAADEMAVVMDQQIMRLVGNFPGGRGTVSIATTVPVFLGDLDQSSPLARQMSEEITRWFVAAGYRVDELRKGRDIIMEPRTGEMILTRQISRLESSQVRTVAVLAGTYTITRDSVRFNMRLLHSPSNQVLAMATGTVPVTEELFPLLADRGNRSPMPSVFTRLP